MGLVSLGTNQFWGRIMMVFMQPSRYPREPHVEHVSTRSLHRFTMLQLCLFMLLYIVKAIKTIAIGFPVVIALCIPFRVYALPKLFTEEELIMLDSDESTIQAWLAAKAKLHDHDADADVDELDQKAPPKFDEGPQDVADLIQLESDAVDEEGEHRDQLTPLPTMRDSISSHSGSGGRPVRRRTGARRVRSVSCPTHGSLFDSDETFPIDEVRIRAHGQDYVETTVTATTPVVVEDTVPPSPDVETGANLPPTTTLRRRRQKTVSCPPHMLFMEAERHVNANYFFG